MKEELKILKEKENNLKTDSSSNKGEAVASEKILIFRASDELFALPLKQISFVGLEVDAASLPQMPVFIEGILSVRGEMIPAIHLAKRLQLETQKKTDDSRHIALKREEGELALIVDEVIEISVFESDMLNPLPKFLESTAHAPYLTGIFESPQGVVSFLDVDVLFSDSQMEELASFEKLSQLREQGQERVGEKEKAHHEQRQKLEKLVSSKLNESKKDEPNSDDGSASEDSEPEDETNKKAG
jgi:purine-binding chemotaxis protein CheW